MSTKPKKAWVAVLTGDKEIFKQRITKDKGHIFPKDKGTDPLRRYNNPK